MNERTHKHEVRCGRSARVREGKRVRARVSLTGGQALLTTVIFLLFIGTAVVFGLSAVTLSSVNISRGEDDSARAYALAESGVEDLVYRIANDKAYTSPEVLMLDYGTATTTVTPVGVDQAVVSKGTASGRSRLVKIILTLSSGASFVYGTQIGDGGLEMENTSKVSGSVYSNGNITGHNSPTVTGDAFAAGSSVISSMNIQGNAQGYSLQGNTIGGYATATADLTNGSVGKDAWADTYSGGTIQGNAYYKTSISPTTTVKGAKIAIANAPPPLAALAMPIGEAQLDQWETDAAAGGTISSPCPYKPADGAVIGPAKVTCDVVISGTTKVTLAGTLWVSGNFTMANSAQLKLASSFGALSGVVVVDNPSDRTASGEIGIQNSAQILGSGQSGSYIMLVSRNNSAETGGTETAIDVGNSSTAAIYYAPHGLILLSNNVNLKEATGWRMHLKNSATVTYESGLVNLQFSSGPTGGWKIGSWAETQ